ncbi:MAG: hypothetical protein UY72_C0011G0008 [Candidatus Uhrbacteria bacterium GW2011_GWD2_52_7]|uniref:Prepilin-type N-terminal cleavage/methylation domain-containing protein n=1 Tax=Candidatus Uhrbacteria bacterium GW2011_GWD2_52_7 TaxID=1618989 RepID=A0A0G1XHR0_9BACT|nr:MAG: hypothetical protein UY72_C0011G0008 [Candidatus Uhrbacteria bacterium GW2011_GWD2_52_7]
MRRFPRGITLIELVITIGVLTIIFGISAAGISNIQRTITNLSTDNDVMSALTLATRRARAGQADNSWGVYIPYNETTRKTENIIVFAGSSYAARDVSQDLSLSVNQDVAFTSVDLSGSAPDVTNSHEIVFQTLSGATAHYGSITLTWYDEEHVITIAPNGIPTN